MTLKRVFRGAMILAATGIAVGGCSDSTTGPEGVAGTYDLISVNGDPLPAVVFETEDEKGEYLAGQAILDADGTFVVHFEFRETIDGVVTVDEEDNHGTYVVSGTQITFTDEGDTTGEDTTLGVISGGRITVTIEEEDETIVLVFEK